MKQYIHATAAFGDGRRAEVIGAVLDCLKNRPGVKLVREQSDPACNRTETEIIGEPLPLLDALYDMAGVCVKRINMNKPPNSRPGVGALDSVAFFALRHVTTQECRELAEQLGRWVWEGLGLPVYFTAENARGPARRSGDDIRAIGYEGLKKAAQTPECRPDLGEGKLHPSGGAVFIGAGACAAVAFTILLNTGREQVAETVLRAAEAAGGGLCAVLGAGVRPEEEHRTAITLLVSDYRSTPLHRVYQLVKSEAARFGAGIVGTRVHGVVDCAALLGAAEYFLQLEGFARGQILDTYLGALE